MTTIKQGSMYRQLRTASAAGDIDSVQILLDRGADVQISGYDGTALQAASRGGHKDVVQVLLDRGADVNAQGSRFDRTVLQAASKGGHKDVVQVLLDRGADVNALNTKTTSVPRMQGKTAKRAKMERKTYLDAHPNDVPSYYPRLSGQQKPSTADPVSKIGNGSADSPARVKPIASMN